MKKLVHVAGMTVLAFGALALQPTSRAAHALYASGAPSSDCLFYKHFVVSGQQVICYDENGTGCTICES